MADFIFTADHLALLERTYIYWDGDAYDGAPAVNVKRPYGNSDVFTDIAEIVAAWDANDLLLRGDEYIDFDSDGDIKRVHCKDGRILVEDDLVRIHREMDTALQIVLCNLSIIVKGEGLLGTYRRTDAYSATSWRRVES